MNEDEFSLHKEEEGGFTAYSTKHLGAIGQGETEEEALQNLREAIEVLNEHYEVHVSDSTTVKEAEAL